MLKTVTRVAVVLLFAVCAQAAGAQTGAIEGTVQDSVTADETTRVDILLPSQAMGLENVVVTALGIERSERSLGYSAQNVSAADVAKAEESNFINALQGQVAGAQIANSTGGIGSSSRIVLRGASSLSGDSQPLIVVDGVAVDNNNFGSATSSGWDDTEIDYGNAAMNVSPQNIKSVNVLKGPNAAAMYGSRAANGAIVIETKGGSGVEGVEVRYSSGVDLQSILVMPDYQNKFGHGQINSQGEPEFAWVDGRGGGTFDAVGESWGPRLGTGKELPQWFSAPDAAPWTANPGNTRSYFNQGSRITNSLSVSGNFGDSRFRISAKNLQHSGMVPNSRLQRTNVTLAGGAQFTERLSGNGKVSYVRTNAENRPERGYTWNNVMFTIGQWTARQINMDRLSEYKDEDGNMQNWNLIHENPYWIQFENTNEQWKDQVRGNISLTYAFSDWFSAKAFTGIDVYEDRREEVYAVGSNRSRNGEYREAIRFVSEWNSRLTFEVDRDLSNQVSLTSRFGVENRKRRYNMNGAYTNALSVPGVHNIENAATRPELQDWTSRKGTNSLYGQASIGFREYLYLDVTGRNNSYFYPSVSLSFIATDAFEDALDWDWLDYAKVRGGWTQVGNDTDPYQLSATFSSLQAFGSTPMYSIASTVPNQDLKPEQTEAWEVGADFRFFNDRARLNLTYYDESTTNQIVPINVSRASGAQQRVSNIGEIANSGIEATLSGTPVQTQNLSWDLAVNFSKNHNEVVRLTEGLESFVLANDGVSIEARPGEEFGAIYGNGFVRDEEGNIVVNDRGIPMRDDEI
ncbi:MAG: SusC/RagA family TonB-linked outer membrane protein, partial [Bacteroidetes bacterium QS_1_65_9]